MTRRTSLRHFVGQNIKGTPAMPAWKVRHDLHTVRLHSDAFVVQEFKWGWYWRAIFRVLPVLLGWRAYPHRKYGLGHPIEGAQAVFWDAKLWTKTHAWVRVLHHALAQPGGSDTRYLRAVELQDPETHLKHIVGGTHFLVAADRDTAMPRRKDVMNQQDLPHFKDMLRELVATGLPILWEMDANIHRGTAAYAALSEFVLNELHGTFHGDLGVEYLFTVPGKTSYLDVLEVWTIPTADLYTDHEGRGVTYRIVTG